MGFKNSNRNKVLSLGDGIGTLSLRMAEGGLDTTYHDLKDGKISPWILLNSPTGKALIQKFNDEQLEIVQGVLDIPFWIDKFKKKPDDISLVKSVIKDGKL